MRRQQVDATKIRKATRTPKVAVLPSGEDLVTSKVGYSTSPTDAPNFSLYNEYLAPGCVGPKVIHSKKTRVYRVLSGEGRLFTFPEDAEASIEIMSIGKVFVCEPGLAYQISSYKQSHLELIVVEDAKYSARLTTLEKEFSPENVELPVAMGVGLDTFTVAKEDKRNYSKKSAQALQARAAKRVSGSGGSATPLPAAFVPEGLNARPTMGNTAD